MIEGTPTADKVIAWKKKYSHPRNEGNLLVGNGWFDGFMACKKEYLKSKKALIRNVKCNTWVTYDNFKAMYENIYDRMVGLQRSCHQRKSSVMW